MDSNASTADFLPVENQIVGQSPCPLGLALQQLNVLRPGGGERVMAGSQRAVLGALEQGKVLDPEELGPGRVDQIEGPAEMEADGSENLARPIALSRRQ